jgi:hypothetical protein
MQSGSRSALFVLLALATACASASPAATQQPSRPPPAQAAAPAPAAPPTTVQLPKPAVVAAAPQVWKTVDTDPEPGAGQDFKAEVATLYTVAACGFGDVPKSFDEKVVKEHCDVQRPLMQAFRDKTLAKAAPFFASIRPKDLPPTVVYPFGGGDLLWALITFPDGLEYTTISLEYAGDPRGFAKARKADLPRALTLIEKAMKTQLHGGWNWSRNMEQTQKAGVPEQIVYALAAMVIHGYEPLSLRYFMLRRDGTIDYLDAAEIEALADKRPEQLRQWGAPDYSKAFSNAEIRFRKKSTGVVKVFRHMAFNLSDNYLTRDRDHLTKDPSLMAHLEAKGPISALTRAASHLLWERYFSTIRDYLTANLVWMPSDSTGVPPPFAQAAGLVQETYGEFSGAYEASDQGERRQYEDALIQLFAKNPKRPLDFLFGYPDKNKKPHLIVTRRPG